MRIQKFGDDKDLDIVASIILDDIVCGAVTSKWDGELFSARAWNTITSLCVKYHNKYGKAPGKDIRNILMAHTSKSKDDNAIEMMDRLLHHLSDKWRSKQEPINSQYLLDLAGKRFREIRAERIADIVKGHIDSGDVDKAEEALASYSRVELGSGTGTDLFIDRQQVLSTFDEQSANDLVEYDHGARDFFRGLLGPEDFVAYLAPIKSGKTFFLLDLAYRAMLQRRRVAFFQVGDLSERQLKYRLMCRAARHPYRGSEWPLEVHIPISIKPPRSERPNKDGKIEIAKVSYQTKVFDRRLDAKKAWETCERIMRSRVKSKQSYYRQAVYPNLTINALGIRAEVMNWARQGWVADVVVIDYADILAPPPGRMEVREQIDVTWRQLRALAQEMHCLVVTATQSDAAGFSKHTLDRGNFSGNSRNLAHATAIIGINVNAREKEAGVSRLNIIAAREKEFSTWRYCYCANALAIANPCVRSVYDYRPRHNTDE